MNLRIRHDVLRQCDARAGILEPHLDLYSKCETSVNLEACKLETYPQPTTNDKDVKRRDKIVKLRVDLSCCIVRLSVVSNSDP